MPTETTTRVSFRLRTDVYELIQKRANEAGIDPSTIMQKALINAVLDELPEPERREIANSDALFEAAREKAKAVEKSGRFDEDFILTVFKELMSDPTTRKLYEDIIGVPANTAGAPKKTPLNMYLAWNIKNAIHAKPLLDGQGKPRRAFVKEQPIKSYTLLEIK
jgi:hypothetical protein